MGEEVREIVYTAANFVFIASVLFIAMLFIKLRSDNGRNLSDRVMAEQRIAEINRYKGYNSVTVTGYDVMSAITSYYSSVPVYVTGAYNYINGETHSGRLYSQETRVTNPDWFKMSLSADPMMDAVGLQSMHRKETTYFAILTYDGDTPEQLVRDLGMLAVTGRNAGSPANANITSKVSWVVSKYKAARPGDTFGYKVSGIVFICIDVPGAPVVEYNQAAVY